MTSPLLTADDATYLDAYQRDWNTPAHRDARTRGRTWLLREHAVANAVLETDAADVLDVGCGEGYLAALMLRLELGVSVVDCVPEAVRSAQYLAEELGLSIRWSAVGLLETVAPPHDFGAVTCTEMIEHVRDPRAVVRRLAGWARKAVVLTTPVGHDYDDPLHLHHWATAEELADGLALAKVFKRWSIDRIPSRLGDAGRVFLVVGHLQ